MPLITAALKAIIVTGLNALAGEYSRSFEFGEIRNEFRLPIGYNVINLSTEVRNEVVGNRLACSGSLC